MIQLDDDHNCGLAALAPYVNEARRQDFVSYVAKLIRDDEGCGIDASFLGFMCDYMNYAQLLLRKADVNVSFMDQRKPPPITVFDIGCASALQHVVFDERIHYVGVDIGHGQPDPTFFRPNCTFVRGRFSDVVTETNDGIVRVGDVVVHQESAFGIANMSLYYGSRADLPLFDRIFARKFVL